MDETSLPISEFLLKRLAQQSAGYDLVGGPEEPEAVPAPWPDLAGVDLLLELPQTEEGPVSRTAAQKAYAKTMDGESQPPEEIRVRA